MAIKRLPMRESVIRRTTVLCAQTGAVNLSQGFSDDDAFPELNNWRTTLFPDAIINTPTPGDRRSCAEP
jgi:hypothetical protein